MRGKQDNEWRTWRTVRIVGYLLVALGPVLMFSTRPEPGEVWIPVSVGTLALCSGGALIWLSHKRLRNLVAPTPKPKRQSSRALKNPSLRSGIGQWIRAHRGVTVTAVAAAMVILVVSAIVTTMGVTKDAHYRSADALRGALESEGFRCSSPESNSLADGYGEEINCEDGLRIITWEEDIPHYAEDPTPIASLQTITDRHVLMSDTWSISSTNRELILTVQETFGGEYSEASGIL